MEGNCRFYEEKLYIFLKMDHSEIDLCVTKFKCLWNSDCDVTLNVDAITVHSWFTLQSDLDILQPLLTTLLPMADPSLATLL